MTVAAEVSRRSRITRDGPALVLSSGLTAALTLGFWAAAARTNDTAAVGRASAEISSITLVASIAQLNLVNVFLRFLPTAGHHTRRILALGYIAIVASAVAGGWAFLTLGLDRAFSLGDSGWTRALFVTAIAAQAIFIVQDGVLTAFGKALWVPLENVATAVVRFVVLLVPLGLTLDLGITGAWFLPLFLAAVAVNCLVFTRLTGRLRDPEMNPSALPPPREIARFVGAEYINNLVSNAISFVPPLLVLHLLGPTAAAYFNVPWLIVTTMQMLMWNVVQPFIVEASRTPESAHTAARQTLWLGSALVAAATIVLLLGAPLLLSTQGPEFAASGTPLLRALALSVPCTGALVLYSAIAIVRRRLWLLVSLNSLGAVLVLGGMMIVLPGAGIAGGGLLYLGVQASLALAVVVPIVSWFGGRGPLLMPTQGPKGARRAV